MTDISDFDRFRLMNVRSALIASADVVGLACCNVIVPETFMSGQTYAQGYRHAIADVRATLSKEVQTMLEDKALLERFKTELVKEALEYYRDCQLGPDNEELNELLDELR